MAGTKPQTHTPKDMRLSRNKKAAPIAIKKSTTGSYTARAQAQGHTVLQQAAIDLASNSKATSATHAKAQFVENSKSWNHKGAKK